MGYTYASTAYHQLLFCTLQPKRTTTSQSKLPDSPFAGGILQSPSTIRSTPRSPVKGQSLVALHAQAQAKDKAKDKEGRDAATTATWTSVSYAS